MRKKLKASYSDTDRPSIDPELLLRILLIGYLYGITSEQKLVEELRMHLAWRWSTGLGRPYPLPARLEERTRRWCRVRYKAEASRYHPAKCCNAYNISNDAGPVKGLGLWFL